MVIGVTGLSCSGKSKIAEYLQGKGYKEIDVDALGHQALVNSKEEVVKRFGPSILDETNQVNRKVLGSIVFNDPEKLIALESIVHPQMVQICKDIVEQSQETVVINAALLYKMKLHVLCDFVFFVTAPYLRRFMRCMKRDHISIIQVYRRFKTQRGLFSQASLADTDIYRVDNRGSFSKTKAILDSLLIKKGLVSFHGSEQ
ncbi:dephospho-CoA kinase [Spirochaeta cellobiosiphila]|uniref:dephospho-CoA kinase n=1 Tax=Spirochaeta cellobiosiphila TaxID=504483 RepID=UPI000407FDDF|nr:dephospho-CoA kinase [Spirochaeta cellobiosiphila]